VSAEQLGHERIEELIAADVLGGLDDADRQQLARVMDQHGRSCPECGRLLREYAEVAGQLAMSLDPVPVARMEEERLVRSALKSRGAQARRRPAGDPGAPPRIIGGPGRVRGWLAAAAVAAGIALIAGSAGYLVRGGASVGRQPAQLAAFLAEPGTRVMPLAGEGSARVAVVVHPGEQAAFVVGTRLSAPAGDRVYELWFQPSSGAKMHPAGVFRPEEGTVVAPVRVGQSFVALAVSVEPKGGSRQPTTNPIFLTQV
jgi:anti-sigma-K factor RskA